MSGRGARGRLGGKVVLVTGAASGIGLAVAEGLAAHGANVIATDRHITAELRSLMEADTVHGVVADVTDAAALDEVLTGAVAPRGGLDGLVHCAAVQLAGEDAPVGDLDPDVWRHTLEINLTGSMNVSRWVVNTMLAEGRPGSLVLCGSPTALRGCSPEFSAYSASKGGLHALTRVLCMSYGGHGIRANTLVPGPTETPLTLPIWADASVRQALLDRVPLGRVGRPADYVGAAVFLISDESAFMTGSELVVDGGLTVS